VRFTRRRFLTGAAPLAALPFGVCLVGSNRETDAAAEPSHAPEPDAGRGHGVGLEPVGEANDLDRLLYPPPRAPDDGAVRELELVAAETEIEIARGVSFAAWTYNGTVPGPVIRATEGDLVRVLLRNESSHPHTVHFHGIHRPTVDGVTPPVEPGGTFSYEFRAGPAGTHLYHCHVPPLATHIARGLYGTFIVDPPQPRPPARELVLVLSGFDLDGDERNELYAFDGRPLFFGQFPIPVARGETVRVYLANLTEYDPVGSFHLHGEFFRLWRTGTGKEPEYTDTVTLAQGERCILEIDFHFEGLHMFHTHQSTAADRGAMGWFAVGDTIEAARELAGGLLGRYADAFANCSPCLGTLGAKALLKY
jgi:FtsP/CotA-like multicopper oxidase with cupredoxin domain